MALTEEQLNSIKSFIKSRGFDTLEVEMEILDHVASAVELKLKEDPNLPMDKAIRSVHNSFGIMGFSPIEDAVAKSVGQKVTSEFRRILWSFLTTERIWMTILLAGIFYALIFLLKIQSPDHNFNLILFLVFGLIGSLPFFQYRKAFKQWHRRSIVMKRVLIPGYVMIYGNMYLLQFIESFQPGQISQVVYVLVSLWMALEILSTSALIKSCYNWANERWLKYA